MFSPYDRVAQLAEQRTFKGLSGFPLGLLLFRLGPLQACRSPEQFTCFPSESASIHQGRLRLPAKVPALDGGSCMRPLPTVRVLEAVVPIPRQVKAREERRRR